MKKFLLILAILCTPLAGYADGDDDKAPVKSTTLKQSWLLTENILPLSFQFMEVTWQRTFQDDQCAVFKNTDLLTPFAEECVPVPFSVLNLLDLCKEQIVKNEQADASTKDACIVKCGDFVMDYMYRMADSGDLVPPQK